MRKQPEAQGNAESGPDDGSRAAPRPLGPIAPVVRDVVAQVSRCRTSGPSGELRRNPEWLRRRRTGFHIDENGRLACAVLTQDRFGQVPEWLLILAAQLATRGDRTCAAVVLILALDWNWSRRLVAAWSSDSRIATLAGACRETVVRAFHSLEAWGVLARATAEDRAVLEQAGARLPTRSQIVVWVLQPPEAWAPSERRTAFIDAMTKAESARSGRPSTGRGRAADEENR